MFTIKPEIAAQVTDVGGCFCNGDLCNGGTTITGMLDSFVGFVLRFEIFYVY